MIKYVTENKTTILVGESATENDHLTTKYSKIKNSNILWFHIDKIPGSHVILIPDEINDYTVNDLQIAANYAVSYSKNRESNIARVLYCRISDVTILKGLPAGSVVTKNEKYIKGYPIIK